MNLTLNEWTKYRDLLKALSDKASNEFRDAVFSTNGYFGGKGLEAIPREEIIDYAYALVNKYGEGSSALACEMYDAIAALSGVYVDPAVPAPVAPIADVGKAINGAIKKSQNEEYVSSVVGRFVKQAGQDTTLKNAKRDGAQAAWIPGGETCAYCLALASYGWQYVTDKVAQGDHAEHIHANCDCAYAVRFDDNSNVNGYIPERYESIFDMAENRAEDEGYNVKGSYNTAPDKLNAVRRMAYKNTKDKINAQKRDAYEKRTELNASKAEEINVN